MHIPRYSLVFIALVGRTVSLLMSNHHIRFTSPLLDHGYVPAVDKFISGETEKMPLLLYLPGFDGTLLAPFLQFPELGSEFDIWGLSIDMDDRSTFEELKGYVLNFLENRLFQRVTEERPLYIMGESFGALLTLGVVHSIQTEAQYQLYRNYLKGVVLINPATCYHRSPLARLGPAVANLSSFTYPFGLMTLLPLFTDEYAIPQLLLMLQGKALPFIINDKAREAYMGRVAFSLPRKLQFMPRETLAWRLDEWLSKGCNFILHKEQDISYSMATIPLVIIAGEKDKTLPSVDEAHRLAGLFRDCQIHIVPGSGHGNTAGIRVNLADIVQQRYAIGNTIKLNTFHQKINENKGLMLGMGERYDGRSWGLSPLLYWQRDVFRKCNYLDWLR